MKKDDQDDNNNDENKNAAKAPRRPRRTAADMDNASPVADKKDNNDMINSPNTNKDDRPERKDLSEAVIDKPRRKRSEAGNDNKSGNAGGGWMNSSSNATTIGNSNNNNNMTNMEEDDPKDAVPQTNQNNKDKHFQDDNDEIILIPDLDEEGGADSDQRIARAPRNVRKIPTLAELEKEVKTTAAAAVGINAYDGGLNLAVLLNTLVPSSMVYESDVTWTFESLLREVTDELSNTPKIVIASQSVATHSTDAVASPPSKSSTAKQNTPTNVNINNNSAIKTKKTK